MLTFGFPFCNFDLKVCFFCTNAHNVLGMFVVVDSIEERSVYSTQIGYHCLKLDKKRVSSVHAPSQTLLHLLC